MAVYCQFPEARCLAILIIVEEGCSPTYATSLDHITIAVRELKEAVHFYTKVLGFEVRKLPGARRP